MAALTIGVGGTLSLADGGGIFQSGGFTNNGNFIVNSGSINAAPITGTGSVTRSPLSLSPGMPRSMPEPTSL